MVIGLTDRQWKGIVSVTDTAQQMAALEQRTGANLRREGDRWDHRAEITAILSPWFDVRRLDEVATVFDKGGLTWAPFRSLPEALKADPDLSPDNPMFQMMETPGVGSYPVAGSPLQFGGFARQAPGAAPVLGQHSEEILAEVAGCDATEIARLFDTGIVAQAISADRRTAA
jgi:2-methylfumaryl-CoA isomerase